MEKYEILEGIGDANGDVFKGRVVLDDSIVDMKFFRYDPKDGMPCSVTREVSLIKELKHENIVGLLDDFDTKDGFCLVFEHKNVDLSMFIKCDLSLSGIKGFLFKILLGLSYCHSHKVIHRDLKPVNMFVDSGRVKLAGFGSAMRIDDSVPQYTAKVATDLAYTSPEYLLGMPHSAPVDIWSVGCIFAEMSRGEVLFKGPTHEEVMSSIISVLGKPDEKDWPGVTAACLKLYGEEYGVRDFHVLSRGLQMSVPQLDPQGFDLLTKMLCMNPERRITASDAMDHPFSSDYKAWLERPLRVNF